MDRDPTSVDALTERIRAERVRQVFLQSPLPIFMSPLAALVLSAALWHAVEQTRLVAWTACLSVVAVLRFLLVRAYPKQGAPHALVRGWERAFIASVLAVACIWGLGGLLLLVDSVPERALVFCFLMLMAGGSAASYAAHAPTVRWTTLALVGPITLSFALVDDLLHRALAFAAVMYVIAAFRSIHALGDFFTRAHRLAYELEGARDHAERLARTDPLTELHNRRAFYELADAAVRHSRRYRRPLSLVMIDIDHFKAINDAHGHGAGDEVIRSLARLISKHFRNTDVACRFGGEEFAVLLPETGLQAARLTAERLRVLIEKHVLIHGRQKLRYTASFGVAELEAEQRLEQLVAVADGALYRAKRNGRNSVIADRLDAAAAPASVAG